SLDVISGGRIVVGMCLGHGDVAFEAHGIDRRRRGKMADEQVEIITRLWTQESVTFQGEFYQLKDVRMEPKPVQKPYPPIWWGGRQKSIPRAARYCQYLNTLWPTLDEVRNEYIPQLKEETQRWGTNTKLSSLFYTRITPDREMPGDEINDWFGGLMEMEVKVIPKDVSIAGSPEQCAAQIKAYIDAGMDHFVLDFQRHGLEPFETNIEQMDAFVERVVPLLG
ncbi:MAG: LLM class flavin-dependent oxidoreductase, partial [Dehalococcoidia bacterium]